MAGGGEMKGGHELGAHDPTSAALSDTNFRKDHRKCAVLDVVEFLVEAGEEAEFCILARCT